MSTASSQFTEETHCGTALEQLREAAGEFILADRVEAYHGDGGKYRAAMYARWLAAVRRFRTEGRA